jgi:hypothetical protein
VCSVQDAELALWLVATIHPLVYNCNCLVRVTHSPRGVPWWNDELRNLKPKQEGSLIWLKQLENGAFIRNPLPIILRKAKRSLRRRYCHGIEDVPGSARLVRIMKKQVKNKAISVQLCDGCYTQTGWYSLSEPCRVIYQNQDWLKNWPMASGNQTWDIGLYYSA